MEENIHFEEKGFFSDRHEYTDGIKNDASCQKPTRRRHFNGNRSRVSLLHEGKAQRRAFSSKEILQKKHLFNTVNRSAVARI